MKKAIRFFLYALLGLAIGMVLLPFLFRDEILDRVKQIVNAQLEADTDFSDISLSLFRQFPNLEVGIHDLTIRDRGTFGKEQLAYAKTLSVTTDLSTLFKKNQPVVITEIRVREPIINAIINADGQANYDIYKPGDQEAGNSVVGKIEAYSIEYGTLTYRDHSSDMTVHIDNIDHSGQGQFSNVVFDLVTMTRGAKLSVTYKGLPYLMQADFSGPLNVEIDNQNNTYTLKDNDILLNKLKFRMTGLIKNLDNGISYDLQINTPQNGVRDLLTLLPGHFNHQYDKYLSKGQAIISGSLKGISNDRINPAIQFNFVIDDGLLAVKGQDARFENIAMDIMVNAQQGDWTDLTVDIRTLSGLLDGEPVLLKTKMSHLVTNPKFEGVARGIIDLSTANLLFQLNPGNSLSGTVNADVAFNVNQNAIEKKDYGALKLEGTVGVDALKHVSPEAVLNIEKATLGLGEKVTQLAVTGGSYGSTSFAATAALNHLSSLLTEDKLHITLADVLLNDQHFQCDGTLFRPIAYFMSDDTLHGTLNASSPALNLSGLIQDSESQQTDARQGQSSLVPKNINLTLNTKADQVDYLRYRMKKYSGLIRINENSVSLQHGSAMLFDGSVAFEGKVSDLQTGRPQFDFMYNMSKIPFPRMVENSGTFSKLAPVAKFIEGFFNSTLVMSGPLKEDFSLDFQGLSASGFMETLNSTLKGYGPLNKLGEKLDIREFREWRLKDSKNWFEVKNGFIILTDRNYDFGDMSFKLSGRQGFDQSVDYTINATIPRNAFSRDPLGKEVSRGLDWLEREASKKGIDLGIGDYVYLRISVLGTLKDPEFKIVPIGSGRKSLDQAVKDKVTSTAGALKDSLTREVKKKGQEVADSITHVIKTKADKIIKGEESRLDSTVKDVESKTKVLIDSTASRVLDTVGRKAGDKIKDVLGQKAGTEIDSIKNKLETWNPFKKKKN